MQLTPVETYIEQGKLMSKAYSSARGCQAKYSTQNPLSCCFLRSTSAYGLLLPGKCGRHAYCFGLC